MPPIRTSDGPRRSSRKSIDKVYALESSDDSDGNIKPLLPEHLSHRESMAVSTNFPLNLPCKKQDYSNFRDASLPKTITINGQLLRPSAVFKTFWYFAAERKAIDDRRRSGAPQPWTDDKILQKHSFCNTFRVLDKACQYLISEVIEKGSQDPTEVVFRVVLFNTFTKIETWELLEAELGPLMWSTYERKEYQKVLAQAKKEGRTLYTGSFQKPGPSYGYSETYMNHLCLLEIFMENDLARIIVEADYMVTIYEYLISFPSMGEFSTFQLMLSLSYSRIMKFSSMDFVVPGPGALSGLSKMFGQSIQKAKKSDPCFDVEVMRWLVKNQGHYFKALRLEFSGLGPDHLPMDLVDIEHLLCEVDKYSRLAHPQLKGKRTHIRGTFRPSKGLYSPVPVLPQAWADPTRRISRIWPGGPPLVLKRYTVHRVGDRREGPTGIEFLVYWSGYRDDEATWEPADQLLIDAPQAVDDFLAETI